MCVACGPLSGKYWRSRAADTPAPVTADAAVLEPAATAVPAAATAGAVVLDYCAAVRGILNDNQGGPLQPPGERMAEALTEVRQSLQRNLEAKKGGPRRTRLARLAKQIDAGLAAVAEERVVIAQQVAEVRLVAATLDPENGRLPERRAQFAALQTRFAQSEEPFQEHLSKLMASWAPGLFAGGKAGNVPWDNLDLERWFRLPKGHERRIHGHQHAGVRLVREGPTLLPALDAHREQDGRSRPRSYILTGITQCRPTKRRHGVAIGSCAEPAPGSSGPSCSRSWNSGTWTKVSDLSARCIGMDDNAGRTGD